MKKNKQIVGLIPAAGYANRISPLPCSKEIYPISYESCENEKLSSPKVISASLLEKFRNAGLENIFMIIRKGKWDIPQYLGTGINFGLNIAYFVTDPTPGTPQTIDKAFHFVKDKSVLFGFPDIQISHQNPFSELLNKLSDSKTDVVLGLFKTEKPNKFDMVETDKKGMVKKIITKPKISELSFTWLLAVWDPVFTDFLHSSLLDHKSLEKNSAKKELYIGHVIQRAIEHDIKVSSVRFPNSTFIDIGTVKDLKKAIRSNL